MDGVDEELVVGGSPEYRRRMRRAGWLGSAVLGLAAAIAVPLVAAGGSGAAGGQQSAASERGRIYAAAQRYLGTVYSPGVLYVRGREPRGMPDHRMVVYLRRPEVAGDQARMAVDMLCGPLCGEGRTLVLTRHDGGAWQVTGWSGPTWVS